MESLSRSELTRLFPDETPRELSIPKLDHVDWAVLDYFGWINSAGNIGFVVIPYGNKHRALRMTRSLSSSRKPKRICAHGAITFIGATVPRCLVVTSQVQTAEGLSDITYANNLIVVLGLEILPATRLASCRKL